VSDRVAPLGAKPFSQPALTGAGDLLALVGFGLACAIAFAGAFIGLDSHGFWFDELFTVRIIAPSDPAELFARLGADVHPPLFGLVLFLYSKIVGLGEAGLRSFSAVAACAAVLVFVASTGRSFSLPGRLFGAAMATGSLFWFLHSQNARPYALCLLVSAGILAFCLRLLEEPRDRARSNQALVGLAALVFVGSFVHFYLLYESLAALIALALLRADRRRAILAIGLSLVAIMGLYVTLVTMNFSQANLESNWVRNDATWYRLVLESCLQYALGSAGAVALVLCGVVFIFYRTSSRAENLGREITWGRFPLDAMAGLLVGVPMLVLAGSIVSSTLFTPNFFDRSFLILSPFLWAFCARLYDESVAATPGPVRLALTLALSAVVLAMASIVIQRLPSERPGLLYEPFRESAEWIRGMADCRGQIVPVLSTDRKEWYGPGYGEAVYADIYGRYLDGFARPQLVFVEDAIAGSIPADLRAELERRLAGQGCPIVAWSVHNMSLATMTKAVNSLLPVPAPVKAEAFTDGQTGYVMVLERKGR
jgi:hypothetical protein